MQCTVCPARRKAIREWRKLQGSRQNSSGSISSSSFIDTQTLADMAAAMMKSALLARPTVARVSDRSGVHARLVAPTHCQPYCPQPHSSLPKLCSGLSAGAEGEIDVQGNAQVARAAIEFYGPDRAKFLGPFSEVSQPSYQPAGNPHWHWWPGCITDGQC